MKKMSTQKLVLSGLFIALGLVLPFLTGQIPMFGSMLLPMHIPVLLCGFICGWPAGLLVGFVVPLLRSLLFAAPPMFPMAVSMAFELAAYGLMAGLLYLHLPRKPIYIYANLIVSMIVGRIVWGIVSLILFQLSGSSFTLSFFLTAAFVNAVPGIILQLILIPLIVMAVQKANLMQNG